METLKTKWRVYKGNKEVWSAVDNRNGYKQAVKYINSVHGEFNPSYLIVEPNQTFEQAEAKAVKS